jgi:integrase
MPSVSDLLANYRADRAPVVVLIDRIDTCIAHLGPVLGRAEVTQLSRLHIAEYLELRLAAGVQGATVRRELVTLRAALRLAYADELIARVPKIPMPARGPGRRRVVEPADLRRLSVAAAGNRRLAVALRLLIATGARIGALCELTWDRVDLTRRLIDLRAPHPREERRKGRAVVPITAAVAGELSRYRKAEPRLRARYRGGAPAAVIGLTPQGVRSALHAAAAQCGLDGITPHVLRHSVATHLLRGRVPLPHVSKLLGHASISITADVYGHLQPDDLRTAVRVLDRLVARKRR